MYLRYGVASALERPHNLVGLSTERVGELAGELVVTAFVRCSVLRVHRSYLTGDTSKLKELVVTATVRCSVLVRVHGSYLTGDTSKIKELVVTCLNFLISSK